MSKANADRNRGKSPSYDFPPDNLDDFTVLDETDGEEHEEAKQSETKEKMAVEAAEDDWEPWEADETEGAGAADKEMESSGNSGTRNEVNEEDMSDSDDDDDDDDDDENCFEPKEIGASTKTFTMTMMEQGVPRTMTFKESQRTWRPYTHKDFYPTVRDLRCSPDWPLAAYWPVYLGNFKINPPKVYSDVKCLRKVRDYFMSKGLPTFMIFHYRNKFFQDYQKPIGMHDMLVYFCSKEDAAAAIVKCHQDLYYNHKLHVYDGRTPERFPPDTTYRFNHTVARDKCEMEKCIELYMSRHLPVNCVRKIDHDSTFVLLNRKPTREEADKASKMSRFRLVPIGDQSKKQRFVEGDVQQEILRELRQNPHFANARPIGRAIKFFAHGVVPEVQIRWKKNPDKIAKSKMIQAQNRELGIVTPPEQERPPKPKKQGPNRITRKKQKQKEYRKQKLEEKKQRRKFNKEVRKQKKQQQLQSTSTM